MRKELLTQPVAAIVLLAVCYLKNESEMVLSMNIPIPCQPTPAAQVVSPPKTSVHTAIFRRHCFIHSD